MPNAKQPDHTRNFTLSNPAWLAISLLLAVLAGGSAYLLAGSRQPAPAPQDAVVVQAAPAMTAPAAAPRASEDLAAEAAPLDRSIHAGIANPPETAADTVVPHAVSVAAAPVPAKQTSAPAPVTSAEPVSPPAVVVLAKSSPPTRSAVAPEQHIAKAAPAVPAAKTAPAPAATAPDAKPAAVAAVSVGAKLEPVATRTLPPARVEKRIAPEPIPALADIGTPSAIPPPVETSKLPPPVEAVKPTVVAAAQVPASPKTVAATSPAPARASLAPQEVALLVSRFNDAVRNSEYDKASALLASVTDDLGADSLVTLRMHGFLALKQGDLQQAREDYQRVANNLQNDYEANRNLAVIDMQQGHQDLTKLRSKRMLEIYPDDPVFKVLAN